MENLENVSPDVLQIIASKMDVTSLLKWCRTSKKFKSVCDDDRTWHERIKKDMGIDIYKVKDGLKNEIIRKYISLAQRNEEILFWLHKLAEYPSDDEKIYYDDLEDEMRNKIMKLLENYLKNETGVKVKLEIFDFGSGMIHALYLTDYLLDIKYHKNNLWISYDQSIANTRSLLKLLAFIKEQNQTKGMFYQLIQKMSEILK